MIEIGGLYVDDLLQSREEAFDKLTKRTANSFLPKYVKRLENIFSFKLRYLSARFELSKYMCVCGVMFCEQ